MYWRTARFAQLGVKKCRDKPNVQSVSRRYSLIISSIRNAEKRMPLGRFLTGRFCQIRRQSCQTAFGMLLAANVGPLLGWSWADEVR